MSIVDYNNPTVARERALALQRERALARPQGIQRTKEQHEAFMNSDFMKKCREHQLAVIKGQERWDGERRRRDPEFQPRDSDWDAPPVRPFDAKCNYYEWLGVKSEATFAEVRKAYKQMCLKYHPDKLRQSGRALKLPGVTGRACDRKYEEQEAREVFLKLQEAFEILSDQATRRQYDRQRISEEESDRQYPWRQGGGDDGWKPPKTWRPKVEAASKKTKKLGPLTPTKVVPVVVSLEDLLAGADKSASFDRTVVGRDKQLHAQKKTKHVKIRRGEPSSKKWTFPGEAGLASADAQPGELVLQLQVDAPGRVRRVGADLECDRVVDCGSLRPGDRFSTIVRTFSHTAVAVCGRAPDLRGRRAGAVAGALVLTKAPRAARAPAPAFVVVDTERLEGMDDDMKERTRARKARERARVDREIALEKRDIARPEPSKFPRDYEVVFDSVNVREAPRLTAKTVGALPRGSVVTAARAQGNWVQLEAANGNAGRWIMVDGDELGLPALLRPVAAATSSSPPPPPGDDEPRLFRSAATERPRFETIDDRRRLCTVLGTKGAAVRKGPEIDSAKVTVLDYLAVCAYTGRQAVTADGRRRVEIDAPVHGWMSLKFLGPEGYE
ncbi:hypothetical protein JL721_870 [Aureococcus anophagefferens]|nr:hypothetical protein JL721_870 [Aureococcus anophagefferens]